MKYILAQNGIIFEKTHDMEILCKQFIDANLELPDWIFDNATLLTNYATQTRYGESVLGVRKRLLSFQSQAKELLDEQKEIKIKTKS
jgi:HEPN domain-containing protein